MSEPRDDAPDVEDAETEQVEGEERDSSDSQDEGEEDEGDEERRPAPKPVDWEKRAHSHAGQAARERSRRQASERRAQELESRLERLERERGHDQDELTATIAQLRDDDEDPVGDIAAVKRALRLQAQREAEAAEQQRQQSRVQRNVQAIRETMADAEADFVVENPDYREAAAYYRQARFEELTEQGYSGEALMSKLADDLFGLVRTAFSSGLDPAERVYNLAKKRGFKAGKGAADKKLDAFDRAGSTGVRPQARAAAGVLSWSDVAKLDGAAREKAWAKLRDREIARK
jgi:hypothetical protein